MPTRETALAWGRRGAMAAAAVLVAVIAGVFLFLATQPGRDAVARLAEHALSDAHTTVRIARVGGNLLSDFRVGEISLADDTGTVVIVENAHVAWKPSALLGGTLDIDSLAMEHVSVTGPAEAAVSKVESTESGPLLPLAVRIASITAGEIALGPSVVGEAQRFSLTGAVSAGDSPPAVALKARLTRIDGAPDHADIDVEYTARPAHFSAAIDIDEPAGGPIGRLAGLPPSTPLSVRLKGAGPPDRWRGLLTARAGHLAELSSDLTVSLAGNDATVTLDGNAAAAALLPPEVRPLMDQPVRFQAVLARVESGALTLRQLTASSRAVSLKAAGRYDPAGDAIAATFSATGGDGLSLGTLWPGLIVDGAAAQGTIAGTVAKPVLSARFTARRLSLPEATGTGVAGNLRLTTEPDRPLALSGTAKLETVDARKMLPAGLVTAAVSVDFDGLIRSDGTSPRLDVKLTSGPLSAQLDAALPRPDRLEGRYSLSHTALGDFFAGIGVPLRARAEAKGEIGIDLPTGDTNLGFDGALTGIASADPWVSAVAGSRASFSGTLSWKQGDGMLRLTQLDIVSDAARMKGEATIQPAVDRLEARYSASLMDLRRFSRPAGVALAGRAEATGAAKGTLAAPEVTAQVATHGLTVEGTALGNLGAGIAARPTARGFRSALRLGGSLAGKPLSGTLGLLADGATLRLQRMKVSLGRNALTGDVAVETARNRLTGDATLTLADARDLPTIAGLPGVAGGSGSIKLGLRYDDTQRLDIDAALKAVSLIGDTPASAGTLTAKVTIQNPFAAFAVDGAIHAANLRAEEMQLSTADLSVKGDRASFAWTARAEGTKPVALSLSGAGTLALAAKETSLRIDRFDGKVADHAVRLRAPAPVRIAEAGVTAGPVDLAVGSGAIRLQLAGTGKSLTMSGDVDRMPLTLASLVAPDLDLAGTVSGRLRLSGAAPLPSIDVVLTASGVRPAGTRVEDFPGVTVEATLHQDRAATRTALKLRGPDDTTAEGTLRTAPLVGLGPPRLVDLDRQTLAGKFEAKAGLGVIDRLVSLGEDRLGGALTASVTIGGTVAQPTITGTASLANGAYEGAATGAVLRDAQARISFTGSGARLDSLTATDGGNGRISGSGTFAFAPDTAAPDRLTVRLERFAALRRPDAEIVATGAVTLNGPLRSPSVEGKLTVDRGELRIPDRLPEDVVDLDVEEINVPKSAAEAPRPREVSASRSLPVALDLAIDFPGKTFVRGRGLDSEWKGALAVRGTSAKPAITGKLSVVRGSFAFAGKTFVLKSGAVTFAGKDPVEPEIDATAEATLPTLVAQVQISGKLSKPSLSVTSTPPMPQEEVLAHILFGRTTGQLSAIQAAQLAQTAATLSGNGGGTNIVDRIRQTLGVDVLNVETGDSGKGASLKAGKYITDNVFLSVQQGTEPGSQKVGVEVEVLPNLSVESDISGKADSNVGVNWKFDY